MLKATIHTPSRPSFAAAWGDIEAARRSRATEIPYNLAMRTVIETPTFQRQADRIWAEEERLQFITWIAEHADAGDVIPGADGARKVRWKRAGSGKPGGVRVIYFNLTDEEVVLLVAVYAKAEQDNMLPKDIRKVV